MIDNKSYKVLKKIYKKSELGFDEIQKVTGIDERTTTSKYVSALISTKFITYWESNKIINDFGDREPAGYRITLEGCAYVENRRRNSRNFWVPYLITTFIALLSLLTSLAGQWDTIISWFSCS